MGGDIECCETGVSGGGVSVREADVGGICEGDGGYALLLLTDEITVDMVGMDCCCCCCCCCLDDRSTKERGKG